MAVSRTPPWLAEQLAQAATRIMAAPTALELGIVLEARVPAAVGMARRALRDAAIDIVPFDDDMAERALHGWRRFGKSGPNAGLNYGDCMTYALADRSGYPILCIGDDFA